jgi:hypothetical protein
LDGLSLNREIGSLRTCESNKAPDAADEKAFCAHNTLPRPFFAKVARPERHDARDHLTQSADGTLQ